MKETIKSIILVLLMLVAIALVNGIWDTGSVVQGNKTKEEDVDEEVLKSTSYLLKEMIIPERELVSFNTGYKTIVNNPSEYNLWNSADEPIKSFLSQTDLKYKKNETRSDYKIDAQRYVAFEYTNPINTYIIARALGLEKTNSIPKDIENTDTIIIELFEKEIVVTFLNSMDNMFCSATMEKSLFGQFEEMLNFMEDDGNFDYYYSMKNSMQIEKDLYIPYSVVNKIPPAKVENRLREFDDDQKRMIAERFLNKDIDYIREIFEKNGNAMFISDKDVLKISTNGTVDYFSPLVKDSVNPNLYDSLITAVDFINKKLPRRRSFAISEIKEVETDGNKGYKFIFQYRVMGIPVVYPNKNPLEIEVYNDWVRSMTFTDRQVVNDSYGSFEIGTELKSVLDIMEEQLEFLKKFYMEGNMIPVKDIDNVNQELVISWIDDVKLCYYDNSFKDTNSPLLPMWLFKTESWNFGFDAENGSLVYQSGR